MINEESISTTSSSTEYERPNRNLPSDDTLNSSSDPNNPLEPLAIIGMAFEFPDGAVTDNAFWNMMVQKRCASKFYPAERMNIDSFYSTSGKQQNSVSQHSRYESRIGSF